MKKNVIKLLIASSLLATGLAADDATSSAQNTGLYAGKNGIYVGGTLGGGSGSYSYNDGTTSYTPDNNGIATTDMKLYVGKRSLYAFIQTGSIVNDDTTLSDADYTAVGIGYLNRIESFRQNFSAGSLMPEFDVELGYDSVTQGSTDFAGLLLSADLGVAVSLIAIPELEFTAGLGYDMHAIKDSANSEYTVNLSSFNFNIGAKYNF